jgi:hypothetical protein
MGQTAKSTRENRTLTVDFHDQTTYFGPVPTKNSIRSISQTLMEFAHWPQTQPCKGVYKLLIRNIL